MHWRIKGVVQKVLGLLPAGAHLHFALQRRLGGLRSFEREFALKLEDWALMARQLAEAGTDIRGARMLEVGTGWYPTLPLACYLAGAAGVDTFDLSRHWKRVLTGDCVRALGARLGAIEEVSGATLAEVEARHERVLGALDAQGGLLGVALTAATDGALRYHAPADATCTGLDPGSVDVVFSNSVLEHVPLDVITALYREAMRVLRPGGLMFHSVNCGDHYAYVDRNIHQLNYLRYSDREWHFWNNRFLYQNRLRAHVFVDEAVAAGFDVVLDTSHPRPQRLEQLAAMEVHPQFRGIPPERLCITTVDFIGRKPG